MNEVLNYKHILPDEYLERDISDIKITANRNIFVKTNGIYKDTHEFVSEQYFEEIFTSLSGGLYAHEETIKCGFFTDIYGNRCGISGRAVYHGNEIGNICDFDTMIIRLSPFRRGVSQYIFDKSANGRKSILIYGPPSSGKTTILRDLAYCFSELPLNFNTVVIDCKNEFRKRDYPSTSNITILKGYSFQRGMDISIKNLVADIVICDEIPLIENTGAIISAASSGVSLYASVHASKQGIEKMSFYGKLKEAGVFDEYICLNKIENGDIFCL